MYKAASVTMFWNSFLVKCPAITRTLPGAADANKPDCITTSDTANRPNEETTHVLCFFFTTVGSGYILWSDKKLSSATSIFTRLNDLRNNL